MSPDLTLWDGGYGPSIEGWRTIRDQVFSEQGVSHQPDIIRFADDRTFNFRDASRPLGASRARAGCSVSLSWLRVDRPLCRLLFELADRARLFILIVEPPEFLRPPSLRGLDLERGLVPISDLDGPDALLLRLAAPLSYA